MRRFESRVSKPFDPAERQIQVHEQLHSLGSHGRLFLHPVGAVPSPNRRQTHGDDRMGHWPYLRHGRWLFRPGAAESYNRHCTKWTRRLETIPLRLHESSDSRKIWDRA